MLLIPHAGKQFAGRARAKAFDLVASPVQRILYVTTNHYDKPEPDHSWTWVQPEVAARFPAATVEVVVPHASTDWEKQVKQWDVHAAGNLLIFTVDLTHYGPDYHHTNWTTPRMTKMHAEQDTLAALMGNSTLPQVVPTCGPATLRACAAKSRKENLHGYVVEYYDSSASNPRSALNRYAICNHEPTTSFVSYVAMAWLPGTTARKTWKRLSMYLAVAAVKTVCAAHLHANSRTTLPAILPAILPSWSWLRSQTRGCFVGWSRRGETMCSTGQYESLGKTTADHVLAASHACFDDMHTRWRATISNIDDLTFKVELLASSKRWSHAALRDVHLAREDNVAIKLPRAIFLPSVWHDNPTWTLEDLLAHLARKGGDHLTPDLCVTWFPTTTYHGT